MQKVYFISGLGANEKAFQYLELPGIEPVYLTWMPPLQNETMQQYAQRMADRITEPNPLLVGLSFGGMLSIEIAKLINTKKIILISSAKCRKEIPSYFRLCKYIPFHKLLPIRLMTKDGFLFRFVFSLKSSSMQKTMKNIMSDEVKGFNKWGVNCVVNWNNNSIPNNVIHIHGTADKLLPYRFVHADYTIKDGTHFMIGVKAKEISKILMKEFLS
jgi:pimeloyl-ACP methyl ester carboxylesterase